MKSIEMWRPSCLPGSLAVIPSHGGVREGLGRQQRRRGADEEGPTKRCCRGSVLLCLPGHTGEHGQHLQRGRRLRQRCGHRGNLLLPELRAEDTDLVHSCEGVSPAGLRGRGQEALQPVRTGVGWPVASLVVLSWVVGCTPEMGAVNRDGSW